MNLCYRFLQGYVGDSPVYSYILLKLYSCVISEIQACTLEPSVVNSLVILFVFDKVLQKCHRHVLIDIKYIMFVHIFVPIIFR